MRVRRPHRPFWLVIHFSRRRRVSFLILLTLLVFYGAWAWGEKLPVHIWPVQTSRLPPVQQLTDSDTTSLVNPRLYGSVPADQLPWASDPPERLTQLQQTHQATRLLAAFQTTLPEPLFGELANVQRAAQLLAGTVVMPGKVFSQNATVGPYTSQQGYQDGPMYVGSRVLPTEGGGVCKIASNLYNVAVLSNLPIVERHPHSMMVPYVPPGQDATVYYGGKDFRFRNNQNTPIVIWAAVQEKTLYIAFYGQYEPPRVHWHHHLMAVNPPPEQRLPNRSLPHGQERLVFPGYPSITVRTWLTIEEPGQPVQWKDLGVDYYRPLPRQIEYGP